MLGRHRSVMNCLETRKQLGSIRPNSADRDAPEFAGAMSHLAGCSQCRTRFEACPRIDRNIGRVMLDVPLPDGLRSRLLESLREADARPGDASGELAGGGKFSGPAEFKRLLKGQRRDEFVRCLTEKMLIYALGRGVEPFDRCAVDKVMNQLESKHYRFSTLVYEIVRSTPFQRRRGTQSEAKR